jgi:exoribonuclease R
MPKIKKNIKKLSAFALKSAALRYLLAHPKKVFSPRQLAGLLKIDNNKDSVEHALRQLMLTGAVMETKGGRFGAVYTDPNNNKQSLHPEMVEDMDEDEELDMLPEEQPKSKFVRVEKGAPDAPKASPEREWKKDRERDTKPARTGTKAVSRKQIEGVVDMTRTGAAYIVNDTMNSDIYVPQRHVNGALHGDTVVVSIFPEPPRRRRDQPARKPEGEVVKVLKRATEFFIGTLRKSRKYGIVLPDNPNMPVDIMVPLDMCGDARDGEKVVVRIIDWQEGRRNVPPDLNLPIPMRRWKKPLPFRIPFRHSK